MRFASLFIFFVIVSCSQDQKTPESAIKGFVEARLGSVSVKEKLLERVTGKLKETLTSTSEAEFLKYADLRDVKQKSFKVTGKECDGATCLVTYAIEYESQGFASNVEKVAKIESVDGKWLISDVANLLSVYESSKPIEVSPE